MLFLAQIDKVDPGFLHSAVMLLVGVIGGGAGIATIMGVVMKRRRMIEPQPFEVKEAVEFQTAKECSSRHADVSRRLNEHDLQLEKLWNTLRAENTAIRAENSRFFADTERALGRIEGKIDEMRG